MTGLNAVGLPTKEFHAGNFCWSSWAHWIIRAWPWWRGRGWGSLEGVSGPLSLFEVKWLCGSLSIHGQANFIAKFWPRFCLDQGESEDFKFLQDFTLCGSAGHMTLMQEVSVGLRLGTAYLLVPGYTCQITCPFPMVCQLTKYHYLMLEILQPEIAKLKLHDIVLMSCEEKNSTM